MPSRPIEAHSKKENRRKQPRPHPNARQHGNLHGLAHIASGTADVLLSIPSESLTHVTSFLDPPDLLSLARTCKSLHAHVADDNTWRRAYVYQYFGVTPESDLRDDETLMLRREESSWKREFVLRYNLTRRWEYSRTTTISHVPHHSTVSVMHLMPHTTLLSASLQYGVVSRSYPLSGKILRGYLDASGTLNGLGIGNPNAEFSPHVTSIAMASEGGTAKIIWGFRNGEVAVTTAVRTMDPTAVRTMDPRPASRLIRCRTGDCHEGPVECVSWATGIEGCVLFVSGGADGRVKLWEAKTTLKCLWTSNKQPSLVEPCVKAVMDMQQAVIAAGFRNGGLLVWTGLGVLAEASDSTTLEPRELRIPAPTPTATPEPQQHENTAQELTGLCIAPRGQCLSLLAIYHPSHHCHRLTWNDTVGAFERTLFGDDNSGPIRAVHPVWGSRPDECDFVITGDQLGTISIYSWTAGPSFPTSTASASSAAGAEPVRAVRRFAAHEDGAVTALAWNSAVLVSGSSRGTIKVWDALTLASLRTFTTPTARPLPGAEWDAVGQILLERDALIVSIGKAVLAWKAGPAGKNVAHGKGKYVRTGSGRNAIGVAKWGVAKWQQQIEMYRDIAESQCELEEEQRHFRRTFGREKEQLSTLAHLGLSEVEAVEYVLMLSRDEEEARRIDRSRTAESSRYGEEGVFLVDFDDVPTPMATPSNVFRSEPSSVAPARTSSTSAHSSPSSGSYTSGLQGGHSFPRRTPSSSNHKIQVSPRARPEPTEAGFRMSPLPSSSSGVPPQTSDLDHFPVVPVSRTPSSASASGSSSSVRGSAPGSPQSTRSAWSTPLRTLHPSGVPSPSRVGSVASPSQSPSRSVAGAAWRPPSSSHAEEDEELRFAIELSLAEARSRGADV